MSRLPLKRCILEYLVTRRSQLQEDFDIALQIVRYRRHDEVDLLELLIALERLRAFEEFSADIVQIFRMASGKDE
jgi:hypothetical protein